MGLTPINGMQIPPQPTSPSYPSKVAKLGFLSKKMHNDMKPMKNNFPDFHFLRNGWLCTQIFLEIRTDFCKPDLETLTYVTM